MDTVYTQAPKLRNRYRLLMVAPVGTFQPSNWRQAPRAYRIIESAEYPLLGKADADRFLFNQAALGSGIAGDRWAIVTEI